MKSYIRQVIGKGDATKTAAACVPVDGLGFGQWISRGMRGKFIVDSSRDGPFSGQDTLMECDDVITPTIVSSPSNITFGGR
jgi:hypothetical protein